MDFFFNHPYLVLLQTAFTVWMLIDAYTRHAEPAWFWVVLLVPVVGAWAYFFLVKIGDFQGGNLGSLFQSRPSLAELRYRTEQAPTLANHLALAQRLVEREEYAEAVPHLDAARKTEPDHGQVLYLLALCHANEGRSDEALPLLERLVAREPRWSNYVAWRLLIQIRARSEDRPGTLAACRELVRLSPTLEHRCLLAEHLLEDGQAEEARNLLALALQEHYYASGPIRRSNRRWASHARRLLKRVPNR
jgi:hypothetical protein